MAKKIIDIKLLGRYVGIPRISVPEGTVKERAEIIGDHIEADLVPGVEDIPYLLWTGAEDCYLCPIGELNEEAEESDRQGELDEEAEESGRQGELDEEAEESDRQAKRLQLYHVSGGYFPISPGIAKKWTLLEIG